MSMFVRRKPEKRYTVDDYIGWVEQLKFGGHVYPFQTTMGSVSGRAGEEIGNSFAGYVDGAYKRGGVVFACILARMMLFSEARFQFRRFSDGRPGPLFGSEALRILERPSPNVSTGELLCRIEQDASMAGNAYVVRRGRRLKRARPDWVTIIAGSEEPDAAEAGPDDIDAELIGYGYKPGGPGSTAPLQFFLPADVAHFSPIPDPTAHHRGMSWLTPILTEISADQAATQHKRLFFDNAATPNLAISLAKEITPKQFEEFVALMEADHTGLLNAYKTLYLGGGADVTVVGNSFEQMSFKATQGAGETRICADAGVPPIIVGLSEGLEASTYSNYGQARRKFGDHWAHPQWRMVCAALEPVVQVPDGAQLWYDARDIPFLAEDQKDAAEITSTNAAAIGGLVTNGFTARSSIDAVTTGDLTRLQHTGLLSVQMQPPGSGNRPDDGDQDDDSDDDS